MHGGKFGPGCLTLGDGRTLLTNSPTLSRCCHKDVKIHCDYDSTHQLLLTQSHSAPARARWGIQTSPCQCPTAAPATAAAPTAAATPPRAVARAPNLAYQDC